MGQQGSHTASSEHKSEPITSSSEQLDNINTNHQRSRVDKIFRSFGGRSKSKDKSISKRQLKQDHTDTDGEVVEDKVNIEESIEICRSTFNDSDYISISNIACNNSSMDDYYTLNSRDSLVLNLDKTTTKQLKQGKEFQHEITSHTSSLEDIYTDALQYKTPIEEVNDLLEKQHISMEDNITSDEPSTTFFSKSLTPTEHDFSKSPSITSKSIADLSPIENTFNREYFTINGPMSTKTITSVLREKENFGRYGYSLESGMEGLEHIGLISQLGNKNIVSSNEDDLMSDGNDTDDTDYDSWNKDYSSHQHGCGDMNIKKKKVPTATLR